MGSSVVFRAVGIRSCEVTLVSVQESAGEAKLIVGMRIWAGDDIYQELPVQKGSKPKIYAALLQLKRAIEEEGNFEGDFDDLSIS